MKTTITASIALFPGALQQALVQAPRLRFADAARAVGAFDSPRVHHFPLRPSLESRSTASGKAAHTPTAAVFFLRCMRRPWGVVRRAKVEAQPLAIGNVFIDDEK
jgi:hypothetical protein